MTTPTAGQNPANPYLSQDGGEDPAASKSTRRRSVAPGARSGRRSRDRVGVDHSLRTGLKAVPRRSRDLLGFEALLPSGMAWLGEDEWSVTAEVSDITYVAASEERQLAILDRWAKYLNSYGGGTRVQETIVNRVLDDTDVASLVQKPLADDPWDKYRIDFNRIVRGKIAAASGNTVTEKYLTITVQAPNQEKAEAQLTRLVNEARAQLRPMEGCEVTRLDRTRRLALLARLLRPYELFAFDEAGFDEKARLATADYVAPWRVERGDKRGPVVLHNGGGDTHHQALWVRDYPVMLSDRLISELTDIKCDLTISLHLEPFEHVDGLGLINRQIAELEMQTISEQKKAKKQGLSEDMIPNKLVAALKEARAMRDQLGQSNEKVFSSVMVIGVSAPSRALLEQHMESVKTTIRGQSVSAELATYMQLEALTTELPVGVRRIPMRRTLTTSSAAILVPFTTQELFVPGGIWYGVNTSSQNAIVADRTRTTNGNGFVLGTSGSGKGVACKSEIVNVRLDRPKDDIIIIDPEREYEPIVAAFGGQTARIHLGSPHRVNPMDIELDVATSDDADPIQEKTAEMLGFVGALIGGSEGLGPTARAILDRNLGDLYRRYAAERGRQPELKDLEQSLLVSGEDEALKMATSLALYTTGSLAAFAGQTTVDVNSSLMSWDISQLSNELRTIGMMVILQQIWNRVARNRARGIRTWLYIDEFHLLFANKYSAEYFRALYKRARKWGLIPTGITQNIDELLANEDARLMLANCDFLLLLGQTSTDAETLTHLLHLSDDQGLSFTNVAPGQGLLKSGSAIIPFDSRIPEDSILYGLYDTKFQD